MTTVSSPSPALVFRGRTIPVVLPKLSDPRLKLSATIAVLTLLGLTVLDFKLSIPQILVTVLLCAVVEIVLTYRQSQILLWPASAIQTGVSVAFIFRVGGTQAHDLWSTRGLGYFALVVALCLIPKHLLRRNGRHIFNPSNIGIAWGLLLIGPSYVFSEHLWWAPLGVPILVSMAVILGGAWWVLRQVKMLPMAGAFLGTFFVLIAIFSVSGSSYFAVWHDGAVGGSFYWVTVALSPELLIFAFFMITDPQTAPKSPLGRIIYAVATAFVAAALILPQTTEFAIKVAILSSLLVTCALVPQFEKLALWLQRDRSVEPSQSSAREPLGPRIVTALRNPVVAATVVIALAAPINTILLSQDPSIELIERRLTSREVQ